MRSVDNPVALITGTNRGSGRGIAQNLRDRGYRIFSLNRTLSHEEWLHEIPCDLAVPEQIHTGVSQVLAEAGSLDVCISNAVSRILTPIAQMDVATWEQQIAVNLTANLHLVQATLPTIRKARGMFVFMGSHAGASFFEGGAGYSTTKAALKAFVETLLLEERPHGVRACLVSPGAIANLDGDESRHKISTDSIGRCVASLIESLPDDLAVGEIEIRPANPLRSPVTGIERLLYV